MLLNIYGKIFEEELTRPRKRKCYCSVVGCKKCYRTDKTLLKINNEYLCKDCAESLKGENKNEN